MFAYLILDGHDVNSLPRRSSIGLRWFKQIGNKHTFLRRFQAGAGALA